MKSKGKFLKGIKISASLLLILVAVFSVCQRLPEVFSQRETALAAAAFTLTDGRFFAESGSVPATEATSETEAQQTEPTAAHTVSVSGKRDKTGYYDSFADHSGEEKYSIEEKTIYPDGIELDGCYIKNYTSQALNFEEIMAQPLSFKAERGTKSPQVLIYHTHTGESYIDEDVDYYYESFYSRTGNNDFNVVAVGDAIAAGLEKNGISVLHDTTVHDSSYNGSYDRSAETVLADMDDNPGIKVVLDIHRDALGADDRKIKTVFEHNGRKGAQIMILSGCDPDNERGFQNWEKNLRFALKLQHTAEELYPGMTRPLDFGYFAYNEYICDGSLLIEIGTDANSIDEAVYSGTLLAEILSKVI